MWTSEKKKVLKVLLLLLLLCVLLYRYSVLLLQFVAGCRRSAITDIFTSKGQKKKKNFQLLYETAKMHKCVWFSYLPIIRFKKFFLAIFFFFLSLILYFVFFPFFFHTSCKCYRLLRLSISGFFKLLVFICSVVVVAAAVQASVDIKVQNSIWCWSVPCERLRLYYVFTSTDVREDKQNTRKGCSIGAIGVSWASLHRYHFGPDAVDPSWNTSRPFN